MNNKNLKYNLFSTYLDLSSPTNISPLHVFGIEYVYKELFDNIKLPRLQAVIMPSFRVELISLFDVDYEIKNLNQLYNIKNNSAKWTKLINYVKSFKKLDNIKKAQLLRLLNKLCLYYITDELTFNLDFENKLSDEYLSEQYYQIILSKYIKFVDTGDKLDYNIEKFEQIAINAPSGTLVKINSIYQMVIQNVKHNYDLGKVEYWHKIHLKELNILKENIDNFTYTQLKCRYYRVGAFIPQLNNNKQEVIDIMNKSELYARKLFDFKSSNKIINDAYLVLAKEMLYPVLESRIQEALWLKDLGRAEKYAIELVEVSGTDARGHLHLGEVLFNLKKYKKALHEYEKAILFSPPGLDAAFFMAGLCNEKLGNSETANFYYLSSFNIDSEGISSIQALKNNKLFNHKGDISFILKDFINNIYDNLNKPNNNVKNYQVEQLGVKAKK